MPRFFFNVHDRVDSEGVEFADVGAARSEAVRAASEMMWDEDGSLVSEGMSMDVADDGGQTVLHIEVIAEALGT